MASRKSTGVPEKPTSRAGFKKPVAWLLGPQLIAALRRIRLYSLHGEMLDARDWMRPQSIDLSEDFADGEDGEFWFDYISDTGDGQLATYSVAYLAFSDLWHDARSSRCFFEQEPSADESGTADRQFLPRGRFLLVGGDTAYHIADASTLAQRFQAPFTWAFRDVKDTRKRRAREAGASVPEIAQIDRAMEEERRPLFGIPGNHDYYDSLDGFARQFRQPALVGGQRDPLLSIPSFERLQEASYVALHLPFGWSLLALDAQGGAIDFRQEIFFRGFLEQARQRGAEDRLIVATPEPNVVFGRVKPAERCAAKAFAAIGLEAPSHDGGRLDADKCRLELAGDIHHYARYWGADKGSAQASNYASVVCGLGGAFLHPSHTDVREVPARARFPNPLESRRDVAAGLVDPRNIFSGGYVWLFGAVLAMIFYFAAVVTPSSQPFLDQALTLLTDETLAAPKEGLLKRLKDLNQIRGTPGQALKGSLLVGLCGLAAAGLFTFATRWRNRIFQCAAEEPVTFRRYWPIPAAMLSGVFVMLGGFLTHGEESAGALLTDLVFLAAAVGAVGSILGLAVYGSELQNRWGKVAYVLLGLWHLLLQLVLPLLLARVGGWIATLAVLALAAAFLPVGRRLGRRSRWRGLLPAAWVLYGGLALALPVLLARPPQPGVAPLALATCLGALFSCVWFGWYLLVCQAFNGHNNEVGGAVRLEDYKGILRIRLRREEGRTTLTAYAVTVKRPEMDGDDLQPRVIDMVELA